MHTAPQIAILNSISARAHTLLEQRGWKITTKIAEADALLVRSYNLNDSSLPTKIRAIARAGVGVNNIPIEQCNQHGIVVFNTPGANANSVKELVIAGLLLSARRISESIAWARALQGDKAQIHQEIEQHKRRFGGVEIGGKTLGVIGLGAIGVMVANAALALGMRVIGYDPFISVHSAWGLSKEVERATTVQKIYRESDWITIHVPLSKDTRHVINAHTLQQCRAGVRLLNFARGELVDVAALHEALVNQTVSQYITDFPHPTLMGHPNVITIPHLGASTKEAEENCARMAVEQLCNYFESGTLVNSVNFPSCEAGQSGACRLVVATKNIPNMVGQVTSILAAAKINIQDLTNRHRDTLAYNIIDVDNPPDERHLHAIRAIPDVLFARTIMHNTRP